MSHVRPCLLVPALALGLLLLGGGEAQGHTVEVTASALNVRSGPSTRYRKIGLVRRGARLSVLGSSRGWYRVRYGSGAGWISSRYARRAGGSSGETYTVTASALNVRSGPSTRYRVLGTVRRGQRVAVTGSSGAWRRIRFNGRTGWVHGRYVARGSGGGGAPTPRSRPRSRAGFIQLAGSGPGFYGYSISSGRWGRPALVYGIERIGRRWRQERVRPRLGVGHISRRNGGFFPPHVSHRRGVDADIRPVRRDSREAPTNYRFRSYSRSRTQRLIDLCHAHLRIRTILFNDRRTRGRRSYPGHNNHLHVSIR